MHNNKTTAVILFSSLFFFFYLCVHLKILRSHSNSLLNNSFSVVYGQDKALKMSGLERKINFDFNFKNLNRGK
jgi:hypothetical protein